MTEQEWLKCDDPVRMLNALYGMHNLHGIATDRKLRLFAVACCRGIWRLIRDDSNRRAVEVAEQYADGVSSEEERTAASRVVMGIDEEAQVSASFDNYASAYFEAATAVWQAIALPPLEAATEASRSASSALADYSSDDSSSSTWKQANEREQVAQSKLVRDIFGNPSRCPLSKTVRVENRSRRLRSRSTISNGGGRSFV
jgi:hypothetical protein